VRAERAGGEARRQAPSRAQLQSHIRSVVPVTSDFVNTHHARILDPGDGLRLEEKTLHLVGPLQARALPSHRLQSDRAIQRHLPGHVDHTHAAPAEDAAHVISVNLRPGFFSLLRREGPFLWATLLPQPAEALDQFRRGFRFCE
jgi:hypothetical protein